MSRISSVHCYLLHWRRVVAQLVEALRYKPECRMFDSSEVVWIFCFQFI
jgi:hypothetical protein